MPWNCTLSRTPWHRHRWRYLIDPEGRIRYVARGALEWDEPGVIRTLERLMPATVSSVQAGLVN